MLCQKHFRKFFFKNWMSMKNDICGLKITLLGKETWLSSGMEYK